MTNPAQLRETKSLQIGEEKRELDKKRKAWPISIKRNPAFLLSCLLKSLLWYQGVCCGSHFLTVYFIVRQKINAIFHTSLIYVVFLEKKKNVLPVGKCYHKENFITHKRSSSTPASQSETASV